MLFNYTSPDCLRDRPGCWVGPQKCQAVVQREGALVMGAQGDLSP